MHCITFVLILSFDCTTFKKSLPLSDSVFSVSGFYWLSHWLIDWLCIHWIKHVIDIRHVHRSANKNIENCSNCAFTMVLPKPPLRWILKLCNAGQIDKDKVFLSLLKHHSVDPQSFCRVDGFTAGRPTTARGGMMPGVKLRVTCRLLSNEVL